MPEGCLDETLIDQVREINYLYSRDNLEEERETGPAIPDDYFDINIAAQIDEMGWGDGWRNAAAIYPSTL